jgi:hypothetical protein
MADPTTGKRHLPAIGNAQKRLSWTLAGLPAGKYYWSVQAIDTAYAGSAWVEQVINLPYAMDIASVKSCEDGTIVECNSVVVTAAFDSFFYVQSDDQFNGIRVQKAAHGLVIGDRVTVKGILRTNHDTERYIEAQTITTAAGG